MVDVLLPPLVCVPHSLALVGLAQGMPDVRARVADDPVERLGVEATLLHGEPAGSETLNPRTAGVPTASSCQSPLPVDYEQGPRQVELEHPLSGRVHMQQDWKH